MVTIGRCGACLKSSKLDDGACASCLLPPRGRKWFETALKIRADQEVAKNFYSLIKSDDHKRLFIKFFGLPPESIDPDAPKLRLVAS